MDNQERYWNNPELRRDIDAAAHALLGGGTRAKRGHRIDTSRPCEAC